MTGLLDATRFSRSGDTYHVHLDPDWFIWGPFGGTLAVTALRVIADATALPVAATFNGRFVKAGAAGAATVDVTVVKRGRSAACAEAVISQHGVPLFRSAAWMVAGGLGGLAHTPPDPPAAPGPRELAPYEPIAGLIEDERPIWKQVEQRPVTAHPPPADRAATSPSWRCWYRLREPVASSDPTLRAAQALLWTDFATWPAVQRRQGWSMAFDAPTIELAVQFHPQLYSAHGPTEWSLLVGDSRSAGAGLVTGSVDVWSEHGGLFATALTQGICRPRPPA